MSAFSWFGELLRRLWPGSSSSEIGVSSEDAHSGRRSSISYKRDHSEDADGNGGGNGGNGGNGD